MKLPTSRLLGAVDWRRRAACLDHDPDLFLADDPTSITVAKAVCADCPVIDACLEDAIVCSDYHTVRAQLTGPERRELVRYARRLTRQLTA